MITVRGEIYVAVARFMKGTSLVIMIKRVVGRLINLPRFLALHEILRSVRNLQRILFKSETSVTKGYCSVCRISGKVSFKLLYPSFMHKI